MNLFLIFLLWRICLFIISYFAQSSPFIPSFPYSDIYFIPSGLPRWVWSWANFDGVHYLTIAKSGYMAQYTQAFFPSFPILIRYVSKLFNDTWMIISGLLISNILCLSSFLLFRNLLRLDYKSWNIRWIILFLMLFPSSFYLVGLYTESLFFILVLATFYFARQKKWYLSGFCGALASITKITGIFLLPAILWEWYIANMKFKNKNQKLNIYSLLNVLKSPVTYLIPSGIITYMIYLQWKFGDWLYFWHAQSVFGAQRVSGSVILPPQVMWRYFKIFYNFNLTNYQYWIAMLEVGIFIFCIVFLILAHIKKIRTSYLIFSWFIIIIPSLTGTLSSIPRYVLPAFPIFISLGLIKNSLLKIFILIFFSSLLIILSSQYLLGKWVA